MKVAREAVEVEQVFQYLAGRTGLTFPTNRLRDFDLGIRTVMRRYGIPSTRSFIQHVSANTEAFDAVIAEITVGETYFFRETAQFDAIRRMVLPSLLQILPPHAPVRVWSAGCATGEEAYSIAILMQEEGLGNRTDVLGTDISVAALTKARKGEYGLWSFRNGKSTPAAPHFHRNDRRFQLTERIQSRVRFDVLNLTLDRYPSPANGTVDLNLILCRNVLIYLDRRSVEQIAQCLFASLANGGWLITGPSDPPLWEYAAFATVVTPGGVFYRREVQPTPVLTTRQAQQQGSLRSPRPTSSKSQPLAAATVSGRAIKAARAGPPIAGLRRGAASKSRAGAQAAVSRIRKMAGLGRLDRAEKSAAKAVVRHPLTPELHFLHAVVLIALERQNDAEAALWRVIYLDRSLAAAHLTLGSLLQRRGDLAKARRTLANAQSLCATRPASEPVPLTDGDTAGRLAQSAEAQLKVLEDRMRAERRWPQD